MATTTFLLQDSPSSDKPLYVDGYVTDCPEHPSVWIKFRSGDYEEHAAIQMYSAASLEDAARKILALAAKLREAQGIAVGELAPNGKVEAAE